MKVSNIRFYGHSSSASRADIWQTNGWTDVTKLVGAFREYAKAPKNLSRSAEIVECPATSGFRTFLVWHLNTVCFPFPARCVLCATTLQVNMESRGITAGLYSGDSGFESWFENQLTLLRLLCLPPYSPSIGRDRTLPRDRPQKLPWTFF